MKLSERYDKKYLGRTGATILVCIAAVVAIVFACYYIFGKFSPQIELSDAVLESVSKTESTEGYIFRDETPVFASSAGGGIVTSEDIAPVTLTVDEEVLLTHIDEGILDGHVAMWMVLHGVANNIGNLGETAIVGLLHGVEDATLHGLEAVVDVRHRAIEDNV